MEKQKKIALINDLTGFGRCSTAVMAPIVSALRIQAVAVPTAILSAHTQFPTYYFDDYTDRMKDYIQTYKDLKLDFDAISTGFLGSEQQVDIVLDFIRHFKTDRNFVIVDPQLCHRRSGHGRLWEAVSDVHERDVRKDERTGSLRGYHHAELDRALHTDRCAVSGERGFD